MEGTILLVSAARMTAILLLSLEYVTAPVELRPVS
jgi:hypothetical protein